MTSPNDSTPETPATPLGEASRYRELLEVARMLNGTMDLEELLREILRRSQEVMKAEACSLFMPDPETGELVIHSALGESAPELNVIRVPKGKGIAGAVYDGHETINIKDTQNDPRHYKEADAKTGFVTRAMVTTPLLNGQDCMGVVQVLNPVGRDFFDEQDEEIFEGFASLIASALMRLEAQAREIQIEKAKQELSLAREIQESFLPKPLSLLPSCQVRMSYFPARDVGGDFYFVHELDDHRTLMGLGDVTGKGIPAALTMARATAEIKAMASELGEDLGCWVGKLNDLLVEELRGGRFIGITFLLTDSEKKEITVCCAGQYPPFCGDGNGWRSSECESQLPIGILGGFQYKHQILELQPGQLWILFSDGISEARNPQGEEFGEEAFIKSLGVGETGSQTIKHAVETWENFVNGAPPHDDASLLLLDWRGSAPNEHFDMNCCTENLGQARQFVENWAQYLGYDDITVGQIVLACDEATTNVYRYAYGEQAGPLAFDINLVDNQLTIKMTDQGTPCDPEKVQGRDLDDIRPGGLGTVLLGTVFDNVHYDPQEKGTILSLTKNLP